LLVHVDRATCNISISPSVDYRKDVFSLPSAEWDHVFAKCQDSWQRTYPLEFKMASNIQQHYLLTESQEWRSCVQKLKKHPDKRRLIYLTTLFAFDSVDRVKKITLLFSQAEPRPLRLEAFECIWRRLFSTNQTDDLHVINLAYFWSKESNYTPIELQSTANDTRKMCPIINDTEILNEEVLLQYLPDIIRQCEISSNLFEEVISKVNLFENKDKVCQTFESIFKYLQSKNLLGSLFALSLKNNIPPIRACNETLMELNKHKLNLSEILMYADAENIEILDSHRLRYHILTELIENLYNGSTSTAIKVIDLVSNMNINIFFNRVAFVAEVIKNRERFLTYDYFYLLLHYLHLSKEYPSFRSKEFSSMMPPWIKYCLESSKKCEHLIFTNIVDLEVILESFESENITGTFAILFVDYVIHSLPDINDTLKERSEKLRDIALNSLASQFIEKQQNKTKEETTKLISMCRLVKHVCDFYCQQIVEILKARFEKTVRPTNEQCTEIFYVKG
jgi:hypothetical protein